jgi:hypothetical protein
VTLKSPSNALDQIHPSLHHLLHAIQQTPHPLRQLLCSSLPSGHIFDVRSLPACLDLGGSSFELGGVEEVAGGGEEGGSQVLFDPSLRSGLGDRRLEGRGRRRRRAEIGRVLGLGILR